MPILTRKYADPLEADYGSAGVAIEYEAIIEKWESAIVHFENPVSRQKDKIKNKFRSLAATWKRDVEFESSVTEMATHPAYQQIIGIGPNAIPLILTELEKDVHHWFWALNALTGVDPVSPDHRGRINEMADDWLRWGREEGY